MHHSIQLAKLGQHRAIRPMMQKLGFDTAPGDLFHLRWFVIHKHHHPIVFGQADRRLRNAVSNNVSSTRSTPSGDWSLMTAA